MLFRSTNLKTKRHQSISSDEPTGRAKSRDGYSIFVELEKNPTPARQKNVCHLRIPLPLVKATCYIGQKWADISGTLTPLNLDKYAIIAQRNWRCDSSPIRAIGFSPRYNLEQGLAETIRWARTTGQIRR